VLDDQLEYVLRGADHFCRSRERARLERGGQRLPSPAG